MDLRVKKTERAIRRAFFQLLQTKPFEKITVKELSELAEINKTTFYAHYETIYDLLDTVQLEFIDAVTDHLENFSLLFSNPRGFILQLYSGMEYLNIENIPPMSANSNLFVQRLSEAIDKKVAAQGVQLSKYQGISIILDFIISGLIGLRKDSQQERTEEELEYLASFVEGGIRALPPLE